MGSGRWSADVYEAAERYRSATGRSAFAYSDEGARTVHPQLDPRTARVRESRDSGEHPRSTAIAVLFDVTGSMGHVPRQLQTRLPDLFEVLVNRGYCTDPQVLFGAIGDATCDRVPLQIGQFESDNRMDDDLGRIVLEGGGGGQMTESYELALYYLARHTGLDCFTKRGRRGYLFVIGDELAYDRVKAREVRNVCGDDLSEDIPVRRIVSEVRRKFDTYYLLPKGSNYAGNATVLDFWRGLLGQNAIELDDPDAVCETIALLVGLGEAAIDLEGGLADLAEVGLRADSVSTALAPVDRGGRVLATWGLPTTLQGDDRISRL